jgi:hypothetical protein
LPIETLDTPRVIVDVPLPNHLVCELVMWLPAPVPAGALVELRDSVRVDGGRDAVVTTIEGQHALVFRFPEANDWDAFITLESRDPTTTIANRVRAVLQLNDSPPGTDLGHLVGIHCPTP